MTARPNTLEGKTIYIVDVNFPLTEQFYGVFQQLLTERYPKTKWVVKRKVGTTFTDDPKLWAEIKEKGDGAIVGPGHMDTLGPAVTGWTITLEKMGVPAAPIFINQFADLIRNAAYEKGMPRMRMTFIDHFIGSSASSCRQYLEANDPVSGKPILEEIIGVLTKQPNAEEKKTGVIKRTVPRIMPPDTAENLQRSFIENGWSDYLPVVLPTEERVAAMLKGTSHKPDEVVGRMAPAAPYLPWEYTVEKVAINAVMAGAKPEHFPVILAIASTGATSMWSSVTSQAKMVVVSGPIRKEIKMNCGMGALSPFNEANAVIGRAWTLISRNLGGSGVPGVTYLGHIGNNLNYNNICCAENEESLPAGWRPFHVQKGFRPEESTVSIFAGWCLLVFGALKPDPRHEIIRRQLSSFETTGTGAHFFPGVDIGSQVTLLVCPETARTLVKEGYETKEKFSQWLQENTFMTMWTYWNAKPDELKAARAGTEPYASMLKLPPESKSPQSLVKVGPEIIVVGDKQGNNWQAGDFRHSTTVSVDKWR